MKHPITAKRLTDALNRMNMNAQELSNRSGVNKASISQYVNGTHAPSNISSEKMGKVLNVNPMWLMGFNVEEEPKKLNAEAAVEDFELVRKFSQLTASDKQIVMSMIDMMLNRNGN